MLGNAISAVLLALGTAAWAIFVVQPVLAYARVH